MSNTIEAVPATIVRVAIPLKVAPFDYAVPEPLQHDIKIGTLVVVPVRGLKFLGIVTETLESSPFKLRKIESIYENLHLGEAFVYLLRWISTYHLLPMGKVLEFMLPIKLKKQQVNHPIKTEDYVVITDQFDLTNALNSFSRLSQKEVVQHLATAQKASLKSLRKTFKTRVKTVLPKLLELGMIKEETIKTYQLAKNNLIPSRSSYIKPTDDQQKILDLLIPKIINGEYLTYLIHGITGSGKTEIYYQLVRNTIKAGKTALILLPEIALTDQTIAYFLDLVNYDEMAMIHSQLSPSQKSDYWYRIAQNRIKLVIGARSALFAPMKNLGLIIIDEEQDSSYKQSDTAFRYHARDLAVLRGHYHHIPVVLGTATPSLETIHNVRQKKYQLGVLKERINQKPLPDVEIIDLKEKEILMENTLISKPLYWALKETIQRGEQAVIYLNKRGYHGHLLCRDCSYVFKCDHCDVSYTYYKRQDVLKCHYCGMEVPKPTYCPQCQSKRITNLSVGTEKVMEDLQDLFPGTKVARLDRDMVTTYNKLTETIRSIKEREVSIIVGTQMIVKGHHFPDVTLVALLLADRGFYFPDFRAIERSFHDFVQVSGRAGRAGKKGRVILQTYAENHYSIQYFINDDIQGFYDHELEWRKALEFPPYFKMANIYFYSEDEALLLREVNRINQYQPANVSYIQAKEAPVYKVKNIYRYLMQMKSPSPAAITRELNRLNSYLSHLKLSGKISMILDRDPL